MPLTPSGSRRQAMIEIYREIKTGHKMRIGRKIEIIY